MLVNRESRWQRGARIAGTPAFGAAAAAAVYLVSAWVVAGTATSPPPPADVPAAHNASTNPRTARPAVSGGVSNSRQPGESNGPVPEVQIDPQDFAALQKALSVVDTQASNQLHDPRPGVNEGMPFAGQADGSAPHASVPDASAIAQSPAAVANPNGQIADAPVLDPSVPPPPVVVNPNGQTGDGISQQPLGPLPGPAA